MINLIRNEYEKLGVKQFYLKNGNTYRNPHEEIITKLINKAKTECLIGNSVIDLSCGSGEVTLMLENRTVLGVDPYTAVAYKERTGNEALTFNFIEIAQGKLNEELRKKGYKRFDTIICSFALHLCPKSLLYSLLWQLKEIATDLIIISPNKKPDCHNISGWEREHFLEIERVKLTHYQFKQK